MKLKIPNSEVQELLSGRKYDYPKYSTQLMNLANQNAQGTRPKVVGQMSELIQEFEGTALDEWEKWYLNGREKAIDNAAEKVFNMINQLKESIDQIDKETVRQWVEELVIVKTFAGLKFQQAILIKLSKSLNKSYKLSGPEDEAKGIDGYLDDTPISIKPTSYKAKQGMNEVIGVPIVYYEKKKSEIVIEYNAEDFTA